jgi:hypothetical protein
VSAGGIGELWFGPFEKGTFLENACVCMCPVDQVDTPAFIPMGVQLYMQRLRGLTLASAISGDGDLGSPVKYMPSVGTSSLFVPYGDQMYLPFEILCEQDTWVRIGMENSILPNG